MRRIFCLIALAMLSQNCVHERVVFQPETDTRTNDLRWGSTTTDSNETILGRIHIDEKGSIFDSCPRMIERVYLRLADEARALGGTEVRNQLWFPGDVKTFTSARCKQRWYYWALFFPLVFGPYYMSATVDAVATK